MLTPHGTSRSAGLLSNACALGSVVAGKYRVRRLLGSGGMGTVYKAENLAIGRTVALKVLHPHLADDGVTLMRFQREARAAAAVGSAHVVQVMDLGVEPGGAPYLVMEYVRGRSLAHHIRLEAPFEPERAAHIAGQILNALSAVHAQGIVHRDLKPENILLTKQAGRSDFVKVFDFGIAAFVEGAWRSAGGAELTPSGRAMGTPVYAAPEQLRGDEKLDQRLDLHAVGVLLYQMLTGARPFEAGNFADLCKLIVRKPPAPLSAHLAHPPAGFDAVLACAMAKKPQDRYADAEAMLEALVPLGADPAHAAEPEPTDTFTIDLRDLRARELRDGLLPLPDDACALEMSTGARSLALAFLQDSLGAERWEELSFQDPTLREADVTERGWSPEGTLFATLDRADARFYEGGHRLSAELGRKLAERALEQGFVGPRTTPELLFSGLAQLWGEHFRDGVVQVVRLGCGYGQVELRDHPAPRVTRSVMLLAFVERMIERCGGGSVDARLVACAALGDACDRIEATWSS